MNTTEIVAYSCNHCGVAVQVNFKDKEGKIVKRITPNQCPNCGSISFQGLTESEFREEYEVEESEKL